MTLQGTEWSQEFLIPLRISLFYAPQSLDLRGDGWLLHPSFSYVLGLQGVEGLQTGGIACIAFSS